MLSYLTTTVLCAHGLAINQLKREGQYNSKVQYDICLGVLRIQTLQNKVIIIIFIDIVCNIEYNAGINSNKST